MKRLRQLGIKIHKCSNGVSYVKADEIYRALADNGMDVNVFNDLFGIQTQHLHGPYPHDVEAVLERMISGKVTGTQLFWD